MHFPRQLEHRLRNFIKYRISKRGLLLSLLCGLLVLFLCSGDGIGLFDAPVTYDPYPDTKPVLVAVTKRSKSYKVNPEPTCWSLDCDKPNNFHAKLPCNNDIATNWNELGVAEMERYLEGDRKTTSDEDYMNNYLHQASQHFTKALEADPKAARVMVNLALVYLEQQKFQSALHLLNDAIEIDGSQARYFAIRSFVHELVGNTYNRMVDLKEAEKLDKYIGERKYFGILLCNTTEPHRYTRWPQIVEYTPSVEGTVARKFLIFIEFSKVSVSNFALLQPDSADFFVDNKYLVIRKIIPPFLLRELQTCYRTGIKTQRIGFMDTQAMRFVSQNDRCGRLISFNLVDLVRRSIAHNAHPTYAYFGGYVNGSVLNPHSDRQQCEFTFSITIQQNPPDQPWPLGMYKYPQFERNDGWSGRDKEPWPPEEDQVWVELFEGDGLLFMGRHMIHFRKGRLSGGKDRWLNQVFVHNVQDTFSGELD